MANDTGPGDVPDNYRMLYGMLYISLAALPLPVYVFALYVIMKSSTFRRHMSYWIIFALGAFECVQLLGHIYLGIAVVRDDAGPKWAEKFFMAINSFTLSGAMQMTFLLSFNRLSVITDWFGAPKGFYKSYMAVSVLYVAALVALFTTDLAGLTYYSKLLVNIYDSSYPLSGFFADLDSFFAAGCVGFSFLFYVLTVAYLVVQRFSLRTINHGTIPKRELVILFQGIVIFALQMVLVMGSLPWFSFVPNVPLVYWATGAYNIFGIVAAGWVNPIMYLTMNRKLRAKIGEQFKKSVPFPTKIHSESGNPSLFHVQVPSRLSSHSS
uniref:G protein-coupled receptor n=1 Tax=Steinernema glaseri TaxID=37863 RepID=A0A1I8AGK9_9BILA